MDLFGQAWENLDYDASNPRWGLPPIRSKAWLVTSWRRLVLGARKIWEAVFYSQLSSAILGSAIGAEAAETVFKRIHPPTKPLQERATSSASAPHGSGVSVPSASAPHGSGAPVLVASAPYGLSYAGPCAHASVPRGSGTWAQPSMPCSPVPLVPVPLPAYLDSTVTWARGKELSDHERLAPYRRDKAWCYHPESSMVNGSNSSMYWESCSDCGARFQRVPLKIPGINDVAAPKVTGEAFHLQPPLCIAGHGHMVIRTNRRDGGNFWGCPIFPDCKQSQDIVVDGQKMRTLPRFALKPSGY